MEDWESRIETLKKLCEDLKLQYQENELNIANRTTAQDKGLDTQLFFKHTDSSQTCKYFYGWSITTTSSAAF